MYPGSSVGPPVDPDARPGSFVPPWYLKAAGNLAGGFARDVTSIPQQLGQMFKPNSKEGLLNLFSMILGPSRVPGHEIESVDPGGSYMNHAGYPSRMTTEKKRSGLTAINIREIPKPWVQTAQEHLWNFRNGIQQGTDRGTAIHGSMSYGRLPKDRMGDASMYVDEAWVHPEWTKTQAFMDMARQLLKDAGDVPIESFVVNKRLATLMNKLNERGKINARVSGPYENFGRTDIPLGPHISDALRYRLNGQANMANMRASAQHNLFGQPSSAQRRDIQLEAIHEAEYQRQIRESDARIGNMERGDSADHITAQQRADRPLPGVTRPEGPLTEGQQRLYDFYTRNRPR